MTYTEEQCISVDWGTSRFRLKILDRLSRKVIGEVETDQGIKDLNRKWQDSAEDRITFFTRYLASRAEDFNLGAPLPVVISGMASSSIGMKELPYATLPFSCKGKGLRIEQVANPFFPQLYLVSGIRSANDIMRGEETQLMGLYEEEKKGKKVCYILPGTHSKHIICKDGYVIDFHTFMTGELYEVIKQHTILKESIGSPVYHPEFEDSFVEGVRQSKSQNLLQCFFKIRAGYIIEKKDLNTNAFLLSGLLIGYELTHLRSIKVDLVYLCAQNQLFDLYSLAAQTLKIKFRVREKQKLQNATALGQLKILDLLQAQ